MELEQLPKELKEVIENLKHGSATIECDVNDALEDAKNLDDFQARVSAKMDALIQECIAIMGYLPDSLKQKVHVVIHMHSGVIYNTGVFRDEDKAKKYRDDLIIAEYGELVEEQEGNDFIDLQECQVIV